MIVTRRLTLDMPLPSRASCMREAQRVPLWYGQHFSALLEHMHGHKIGSYGTMQPVQVAHHRVWQVCQLELCTWHHQSPLQCHIMVCE